MKHSFFVPGNPVGKPRMTRRDRWATRAPVLRYRAWSDLARAVAAVGSSKLPPGPPLVVDWIALFEPETPREEQARIAARRSLGVYYGWGLHRQKPDRDNIDKALLDALLTSDAEVAVGLTMKVWCYKTPGLAVVMWYDEVPDLTTRFQEVFSAARAVQEPGSAA